MLEKYGDVFESLVGRLWSQQKDRKNYYQKVYKLFEKEVHGRWNSMVGRDLTKEYPENYSFIDIK